ncbi:MAG: hypothetical protein LBH19_15790 [Dysgonamonadaceae bacterium]|nr:hypothetical protein [Dysgonamonadaceae bacterium]
MKLSGVTVDAPAITGWTANDNGAADLTVSTVRIPAGLPSGYRRVLRGGSCSSTLGIAASRRVCPLVHQSLSRRDKTIYRLCRSARKRKKRG